MISDTPAANARIAVIGGTGLYSLNDFHINSRKQINTSYGSTSASLVYGNINNTPLIFLPRHGEAHTIPPHKVNYRANIQALYEAGIQNIIAVNAVGGITEAFTATSIAIPDQIIDYTHSREHSYFDGQLADKVSHIDFTQPYSEDLRKVIIDKAKENNISVQASATYAVTQGPRLETAAEIRKLERDGCDIVGMTAMPEAGLARELGIRYASISVVANMAAGKDNNKITMDIIEQNLKHALSKVLLLLEKIIPVI